MQSNYANGSAAPYLVLTQTQAFDNQGNLVARSLAIDNDGDGVNDSVSSFVDTFDSHHNMLTAVVTDTVTIGSTSFTTTTRVTQTFNAHGLVLTRVEATDSDGDGVADTVVSATLTYDQHDNLLAVVQTVRAGQEVTDLVRRRAAALRDKE